MRFLHVFGPDTKNTYGILSQLYSHCDPEEHRFLIAAYASAKTRFPKLEEFPALLFIPEESGRLGRIRFFQKQLDEADVVIWHSLYFTTQKYLYFLYVNRKYLKKSVWIEWGADLYLWQYDAGSLKGRIKNHINGAVRRAMPRVGCCFPVDEIEVHRQFGEGVQCFYTPLANPKKEATGLIEQIEASRPEGEPDPDRRIQVQIAHNSFQFNNHVRIIERLRHFKDENVRFILPLSYGIYGINGQYGGVKYRDAVIKYAREALGKNKVAVIKKNIPFDSYIRFLWNIDVVVFDFDRPCGLGTLRILLLMGKKIFLPAGTPYYDFLVSKGLPIFDTNAIRRMSWEEFTAPPVYTTKEWVYSYMNNDDVIQHWLEMFETLKQQKERGEL